MSRLLVIHISNERLERIRSQGYAIARNESPFSPPNNSAYAGDTLYHVLDLDQGPCINCGNALRMSVQVETPAELETLKHRLRYGPFPTIMMDRCGLELDLSALAWLNKQMEYIATQSDYQQVNLQITRVPVPERFARFQDESVVFPDLVPTTTATDD